MADASPSRPLPHLRWWIVAALFLASALTYLDRQALSVLATTVQKDLGIDDRTYARIGQAFLVGYAAFYLASGWLVDRIGVRLGQTLFIGFWSVAKAATGLVNGALGVIACRGLLDVGGLYLDATNPEWFPCKPQ